jgi:putative ABC transport system permease protein
MAVGGFAVAVLLFAGLSWVAVKLLRKSVNEATAPRWLVLATRQISARPAYAVVQVSALAVGLLALVLLVLLRTDLVASWRKATPPDAPNRFVINVMPEQSDAFQKALRDAGVKRFDWYPMIRGRLIAVNGKTVTRDDYIEDRAKRLVDREFNLSSTPVQPPHNQVVAGRWEPEERGAVSVEEGIATTLGLKLGDELRFDIGGQQTDARITSLRKVDWSSMRANFFVIYPVSQLDDVAITYMSAFRAPERRWLRQPVGAGVPQHHQRRHDQHHQPGAGRAGQGDPCGGVPVRASRWPPGWWCCSPLSPPRGGAGPRVRDHARRGRQWCAAAPGPARGADRHWLLAGFLASVVASVVGWGMARYAFDFDWTASPGCRF